MTKLKHRILTKVYNAKLTAPVCRTDFYKRTRKINLYKRAIDELIDDRLLRQRTGCDVLEITKPGISALEAADSDHRKSKCEALRYWITTGIAVLALIISIIALVIQ